MEELCFILIFVIFPNFAHKMLNLKTQFRFQEYLKNILLDVYIKFHWDENSTDIALCLLVKSKIFLGIAHKINNIHNSGWYYL